MFFYYLWRESDGGSIFIVALFDFLVAFNDINHGILLDGLQG